MTDGLDEFRAFAVKKGPQCSICRVMATMTDEDRDKVARAIASPDITDVAVGSWITSHGYTIDISDPRAAIRNHRQQSHV